MTAQVAPKLVETFGIGADTAAEVLIVAGDNPERIRTEGAWAKLCGVAPIPASSGKKYPDVRTVRCDVVSVNRETPRVELHIHPSFGP